MCGIAGLIESQRNVDPAGLRLRVSAMMHRIRHRGPDDWGMALFNGAGDVKAPADERVLVRRTSGATVMLGHQRLSILDLSAAGRQPMQSTGGDVWLTFNGEIYNYVELRRELADYEYRSGSDTEVILAAYRRWGVAMLERFDGMFAFALWDAAKQLLVCARDPLGIKPFYYAIADGLFVFASETNAVLAGLGRRGTVDRERVADFLVLGITDHDEGTCYADVKQLRGGDALLLDTSSAVPAPRFVTYWQAPTAVAAQRANVAGELYDELRGAVMRQLRADVPVGGCLSGGLDSGAIAATVGDVLGDARGAYAALTLTNAGFEGDESRLAAATASRAGLAWHPVEVSAAQVLAGMRAMIERFDQPFSSLSMFGQYSVFRRARDLGLKVMLDGQGGDEIFLGYERVAQRSVVQWVRDGRPLHAASELLALRRHASIPIRSALAANAVYARPSILAARNQRRMRPLVSDGLAAEFRAEHADAMYSMSGGIFALQRQELVRYSLPRLLRFEDRNSMAFGIEARVPLLARNLVEFALRLPLDSRVHHGWTKYALRQAVSGRLPDEVAWNPIKRGFEVPQQKWVEALKPWLTETLSGVPAHFPLRTDALLAAVDRGEGGSHHIWRGLSVALWARLNDVGF